MRWEPSQSFEQRTIMTWLIFIEDNTGCYVENIYRETKGEAVRPCHFCLYILQNAYEADTKRIATAKLGTTWWSLLCDFCHQSFWWFAEVWISCFILELYENSVFHSEKYPLLVMLIYKRLSQCWAKEEKVLAVLVEFLL